MGRRIVKRNASWAILAEGMQDSTGKVNKSKARSGFKFGFIGKKGLLLRVEQDVAGGVYFEASERARDRAGESEIARRKQEEQ